MNPYFDIKDTIYDITTEYPEAVDLLVNAGLTNMKDPSQRESIGKHISLEMALRMKSINVKTFEDNLIQTIYENRESVDAALLKKEKKEDASIRIDGVLPCPIKIPLLEGFENWLAGQPEALKNGLDYELKAASMGVDWLMDGIKHSESADVLSDLFISAGFDLFFDKALIGKYKDQGAFADFTNLSHYNEDFENESISLKDPMNQYAMLGVVPAVFLVNREELGDRPMPESWADILRPEYENSVSLPIGDFDLFNAILLNIHKTYGEDGVLKLGKSLLRSMHPSEMVKSHIKKANRPAITIMPYFFTKMTKNGGPMVPVWPLDGAIISPIFMLSKANEREILQPIVDFFSSKAVGEILAHQGLFPSVHPEVDNQVPKTNKYMWLGWDYINQVNMGPLIKNLETLFNSSVVETTL